MKADTTRSTFKSAKHYKGVRMQQGRVQLDADWNEQVDITGHRIETETVDVVGICGAPIHDSGFHVVASAGDLTAEEKALVENQNPPALQPGDLLISGGRYYVDGVMCENEQIVAYTGQPDLPDVQAVTQAGTYLAYVDVWSRHLTALEDPAIREVALGGPDTATRSRNVWQVKLSRVGEVSLGATCSSVFASWNTEIAAGTGMLAARAAVSAPSNDPCIVAPGAGFRRLENQHYRVEVHDAGALGVATFKWSRDNGSIVTRWESQNVDKLTVSSIGRDRVLSFASGQWVELLDDTSDLLARPGTLVQLVKAEGNVLTINPATATGPVDIASFPRNPKVRRWDMPSLLKPTNQNWLDLEDGVQVHFIAGTYKTGDYWLIPARTATADVEWPVDPATNQPATQLPSGIKHHYCRLAVLTFDATKKWTATDCRDIFPPLTELTSFFYVGGDGQEAMPDLTQPTLPAPLAQPLEVGVTNGQWPVAGATVRFTITKGNGQLQGGVSTLKVATGANGIASCTWSLGSSPNSQQVEAVLLNDIGNPVNVPIHFTANLSVADQVAYNPKQCGSLNGKKTVQTALDQLTSLASLFPVSGDNQTGGAGQVLVDPLIVVASSDCGPVDGMTVVFTVKSGGGTLKLLAANPAAASVNPLTGPQGLASCIWTLGSAAGAQVVEAVLQSNASHPTVPPTIVRFSAQLPAAGQEPGFHVTGLFLDATNVGSTLPPLRNDMTVPVPQFRNGLQIECDAKVDPISVRGKPVCFVTLEIPFFDIVVGATRRMVCFQPVILDSTVQFGAILGSDNEITSDADLQKIVWTPTAQAANWIENLLASLKETNVTRLLARLTVMGNFIWEEGNPDIYLDGEVFGLSPGPPFDLRLPRSGDGKRGGDLKMWFWIGPQAKTSDKNPKESLKEKEIQKDNKDIGEGKILKDREIIIDKNTDSIKTADASSPAIVGALNDSAVPDSASAAVGRSFIQPEERPAVDQNVFDEPAQG